MRRPRGHPTRLATPFTVRCASCGTYIYRNKRHNAFKETAEGKAYLGIEAFRFHIKCTGCRTYLSLLTDPKSGAYVVESGCTRVAEEESVEPVQDAMAVQLKKESDMRDEIERFRKQASKVDSSQTRNPKSRRFNP